MSPNVKVKLLKPSQPKSVVDGVRWRELRMSLHDSPVVAPRPLKVNNHYDLMPLLHEVLDHESVEVFVVVPLDARNVPIGYHILSRGCLTWAVVHPREVYTTAVHAGAQSVIVAHNHPSGDTTPSTQDIEVTQRLYAAGDTLGIQLLDHIVVTPKKVTSMRAAGLFPAGATPSLLGEMEAMP